MESRASLQGRAVAEGLRKVAQRVEQLSQGATPAGLFVTVRRHPPRPPTLFSGGKVELIP